MLTLPLIIAFNCHAIVTMVAMPVNLMIFLPGNNKDHNCTDALYVYNMSTITEPLRMDRSITYQYDAGQ